MKLNWLTYSSLALILFSCEKPPEIPGKDAPIFYVEDNSEEKDPFGFNAGEYGVYMHTGNATGSDSVLYYFGSVGQKNLDSGEIIEFRYRAPEEDNGSSQSLFNIGQYPLFNTYREMTSPNLVNFKLFPNDINGILSSVYWEVNGDPYTSSIANFKIDTTTVKTVEVKANFNYQSGCQANMGRTIALANPNLRVEISHEFVGPNVVEFLVSSPTGYASEEWFLNGTKVGSGAKFVLQTQNYTNFKVEVSAKNGNQVISAFNEYTLQDSLHFENCVGDFFQNVLPVLVEDKKQLGTFEILFKNASGEWFTTQNLLEPGYIEILKIEQYHNNENGEPVKKLALKGSFILANETGQTKEFRNFQGVIAIGAK